MDAQDLGLLVCVPAGPALAAPREPQGTMRVVDGAIARGEAAPALAPVAAAIGGAPAEDGGSDGEGAGDGEVLSREALWHGVLAVLTRSAKAPSVSGAFPPHVYVRVCAVLCASL